jgi:hypothetical protein
MQKTSNMYADFHVPYVYEFITKLCRKQADIVHNHENESVRNAGQGETPHRKYKRPKLGASVYTTAVV